MRAWPLLVVVVVVVTGCPDEPPMKPRERGRTAIYPEPPPTPRVSDEIDPETGLKRAVGYEVVASTCSACHSLTLVTQNAGDEEDWRGVIRWMQETQNLFPIPEKNLDTIVSYLALNYPRREGARRAQLPRHLRPPLPPSGR